MQIATWTIFIIVYAGLGMGRLPKLRLDRAGIALAGSAAILCFGILSFQEAIRSIDFDTIVLLFSMMAIVAFLEISGFFFLLTDQLAKRCRSSHALLFAVITSSGVLSAFFVNDVVCIALTPLVMALCLRLKKPPVPFLLALAMASNIGSVATITGNPQNVIIGSISHISYLRFASRLAPIALVGLALNFAFIAFFYRKELSSEITTNEFSNVRAKRPRIHQGLLIRSIFVSIAVVICFLFLTSLATASLVGACVLLLQNVKPRKIYSRIDWPLLIMFAGLFVVVHAFDVTIVRTWGIETWKFFKDSPVVAISLVSAALSNLVSNVPAVLLLKPLMTTVNDREQAWLALSMSSTLAGNFTILGSVANLVVVESCRRRNIKISFFDYLKVGVPLSIATLAVGILWLALTHY